MFTFRRPSRVLAAAPIGALLAVGLSVIPATTVQAEVVHHTKAGEVSGPLNGSEIRRLPFPAGHAALYWDGNPDANVTVSFSTDGVTFGPAVAVEEDEVGMQLKNGQTYGAVLPAGGATAARVASDRPIGRLTLLALTDDGTSVVNTPVARDVAGAQTAGGALPRSAWGADESLRFDRRGKEVWPPVFQTVQKLVVHHTAGVNGESGATAQATIRSIYYYHAITQGWGDIGYNFLIDAAGVVYKGRSTSTSATDPDVTGENGSRQVVTAGHAYGYNSGTVGVALLGNFVNTVPTGAAQDAVQAVLVREASAHGIDAAGSSLYTNPLTGTQDVFLNVPGHGEVPNNATECPGGAFLSQVLGPMRGRVAAAATPPDTVAPAAPATLTGAAAKRSVQLKWSGAADTGSVGGSPSGVAGYDVTRSLSGGPITRLTSTSDLTFTDTTTTTRATYDYVVTAFDGAGNRGPGRTLHVTT